MRNLPLPTRDSARDDLVGAIRIYRYGGVHRGHELSASELNAILALYDRYDRDHGAPCDAFRGSAFPRTLVDALENAYGLTQAGRRLDSIRNLLFSGVVHCPICGIDPVVELDHFLPISSFKPLAIYARNLVPMCNTCNHAKLAGFGNQDDADTRFVHAYFDLLPDREFLKADVSIHNGGLVVQFSIADDAALPGNIGRRLANQLVALDLHARYEREVNTYISSHTVAIHLQFKTGGAENVRAFLDLQARVERDVFYRNHWRPVLLGALARDNGFINGGFVNVLPIPSDIGDDLADLAGCGIGVGL